MLFGWVLNGICIAFTVMLLGVLYKKYPNHPAWKAIEGAPAIILLSVIPYLYFITCCLVTLFFISYHLTKE